MFDALKNFDNFSGRAARKEYWFFPLTFFIYYIISNAIISNASAIITDIQLEFVSIPFFMIHVFFFIAWLSVSIRRLHDTDRSGWWLLLIFIPIIGMLILLCWLIKKGTHGKNRFGDDPKGDIPEFKGNSVIER